MLKQILLQVAPFLLCLPTLGKWPVINWVANTGLGRFIIKIMLFQLFVKDISVLQQYNNSNQYQVHIFVGFFI